MARHKKKRKKHGRRKKGAHKRKGRHHRSPAQRAATKRMIAANKRRHRG